VYIFEDTQVSFVHKLGNVQNNSSTLKVAIIWRHQESKLQYDWLENGWPSDPVELQRSRRSLKVAIEWILTGSDFMPFIAHFPNSELIDEHAEGLLFRIISRLCEWYNNFVDKIVMSYYGLDEVFLITMLLTVGFVVVVGFVMSTLTSLEEQRIYETTQKSRSKKNIPFSEKEVKPPTTTNSSKKNPTYLRPQQKKFYDSNLSSVDVHELNLESFNNLILGSEPGVRVLVILVDYDTKEKLLNQFKRYITPYSKTDAFVFAYLQLEHHLDWYRHLLEETLDFKRNLQNINKKNCIGTLLAINGLRKYYCIYHAQNEKARLSEAGSFMGFETDSDTDNESMADFLFEADLLKQLPNWMDRLCEGSLRRFRVEYWPIFDKLNM